MQEKVGNTKRESGERNSRRLQRRSCNNQGKCNPFRADHPWRCLYGGEDLGSLFMPQTSSLDEGRGKKIQAQRKDFLTLIPLFFHRRWLFRPRRENNHQGEGTETKTSWRDETLRGGRSSLSWALKILAESLAPWFFIPRVYEFILWRYTPQLTTL